MELNENTLLRLDKKMKRYEVSFGKCVEIDEKGNRIEINSGITANVPYVGLVAIQRLLGKVLAKMLTWSDDRLTTEEKTEVEKMIA
jgi:hypothetical protein